jgi:hypothetical protein
MSPLIVIENNNNNKCKIGFLCEAISGDQELTANNITLAATFHVTANSY